MLFPFSDPADSVTEPPGDFRDNYRRLKGMIDTALREGTPLEELHLIPKDISPSETRQLSRDDLLKLLKIIRNIKSRYKALLKSPVPKELERDILAKSPEDRLPWEEEALEKVDGWRSEVKAVRARVQKELNDHLKRELFQGI